MRVPSQVYRKQVRHQHYVVVWRMDNNKLSHDPTKVHTPSATGLQDGISDTKTTLGDSMKKLKNESELVKGAILAGVKYGEARGAVEFEPTDSAADKILYIYRLLIHDKKIQALPEDQVSQKSMRHKLAIWHAKQLPKDHPLLK